MGYQRNRTIVTTAKGTLAYSTVDDTSAYQTLLDTSSVGRVLILVIENTLNSSTTISLDGGTTNWGILEAGDGLTLNFGAAGLEYSGVISVKYTSAAPTSGNIHASVIRTQ
jgi:hypothetical protein